MSNNNDQMDEDLPVAHTSQSHRHHSANNYYEEHMHPELPALEYEDDWKEAMGREMQEIVPNLYLGPYSSSSADIGSLGEMKIIAGLTHIVCVRQKLEQKLILANFPDFFTYLIVEVADNAILSHLPNVNAFLDECLINGGKALVHGNNGSSRSPAFVIGYLMWRFGANYNEAQKYVQTKRSCICLTDGLQAQLREYDPICQAMQTSVSLVSTPLHLRSEAKYGGSVGSMYLVGSENQEMN